MPHFSDTTAATLLPPAWSFGLRVAKRRGSLSPTLSIGTDLVAVRTLLIDQALRAALARGVKQVVILGAGLDGRAYRIPELAAAHVFEVDHPATQAYKRRKAKALVPTARDLRYVAVDFERDDLGRMLEANGHDPSVPTFFLWEGVVLYLTNDAVKATLRTLAERAASGSDLVATYGTPTRSSPFREVLFRFWGEPPIGERTRERMAELLEGAGFQVLADDSVLETASRFGGRSRTASRRNRYRLVVARTS